MEACNKTIGSLADMLPSRNIVDIIKVLIENDFKICEGSKGEKKIKEYLNILEELSLDINLEESKDAVLI